VRLRRTRPSIARGRHWQDLAWRPLVLAHPHQRTCSMSLNWMQWASSLWSRRRLPLIPLRRRKNPDPARLEGASGDLGRRGWRSRTADSSTDTILGCSSLSTGTLYDFGADADHDLCRHARPVVRREPASRDHVGRYSTRCDRSARAAPHQRTRTSESEASDSIDPRPSNRGTRSQNGCVHRTLRRCQRFMGAIASDRRREDGCPRLLAVKRIGAGSAVAALRRQLRQCRVVPHGKRANRKPRLRELQTGGATPWRQASRALWCLRMNGSETRSHSMACARLPTTLETSAWAMDSAAKMPQSRRAESPWRKSELSSWTRALRHSTQHGTLPPRPRHNTFALNRSRVPH
jgi:hypothetical protein